MLFEKFSDFSMIFLEPKDTKICVTATQGFPLQQSLLSYKSQKTIMMEESEEKKVLKDPKLKQLEDLYVRNENYLESFNNLKNPMKIEFLENSFSVLRDFKTSITQSLRLKKIIKYFQKVMKNMNYQENFYIITKHTTDILDCEKVFFEFSKNFVFYNFFIF